MTDATIMGPQPVVEEREKRKEYRISFGAQVTIIFTGALVIFLNLVKYGYDNHLWWWLPDIGMAPSQAMRTVDVALICIDGAAKAAIVSFAATFILRINIKKVIDQVIHAQPLLADPAEGERLRELLRGEVATLSRRLQDAERHNAALTRAVNGFVKLFGEFENLTQQASTLRDDINRS